MLSERAPRLEAAVLKIERVNIKLLSNDVGRASYSDLWSIPAPPRTLVVNWLTNRLGSCDVKAKDVVLTLPDGKTTTGDVLIASGSKLRMGDIRLGESYLPDGMRPMPIGEVENRILEKERVLAFIRRPPDSTVSFKQRKPAADNTPVVEWLEKYFGEYGISPDEVILINGHAMMPFKPNPYYTMGQLRASFKGKAR